MIMTTALTAAMAATVTTIAAMTIAIATAAKARVGTSNEDET